MTDRLRMATLLAVLPLMLGATAAPARDCQFGKGTSASACAEGSVWDAGQGRCVAKPTS
ncbi:hypothetical protein [Pseudogemmobacter humi]|uniref:Chitin-binding type-2 domain-containing protein n=1 Tax=Pseudogemmobacter humi TaxID=2483812 RepID=A0A3P5XJK4_9RHOB|nr:hypothetical protein [Pseudogemmobacter humi]VDC31814.1 hypothetical protein XINFAN_03169 [Pseudogemmobacter humi]